ncbi:hypothetical protein VUR80DRAFT_5875 [Thermomyces stellatus]
MIASRTGDRFLNLQIPYHRISWLCTKEQASRKSHSGLEPKQASGRDSGLWGRTNLDLVPFIRGFGLTQINTGFRYETALYRSTRCGWRTARPSTAVFNPAQLRAEFPKKTLSFYYSPVSPRQ